MPFFGYDIKQFLNTNIHMGFGHTDGSLEPKSVGPDEDELAIPSESVNNRMPLFPYSPDPLILRKGFKILDKMANDDQIAQNLTAFKVMRLSTGWTIEAADDSVAAEEHKEFIEFNLIDHIQGSFNQDLFEIGGALALGYSISEKNWNTIEKGKWKGKIGIKNIKSKRPQDFNIYTDEFSNPISLVKIEQPDIGNVLPIDKFIVYSFRKRYENVFGTAITRSLYDLWWLKHIVKRAMGVYIEKYGVPITLGKYKQGFKNKNVAFRMLKALRTETVALIPEELEVEFKAEAGRGTGGVDLFLKTIGMINDQMSKTILGQTLTQSAGDKGSQSLGRVHEDILTMHLEEFGSDLEDLVNEQLIRDLIDFNFPNVDEYPKLKFKPIKAEDKGPQIDRFIKAKDAGLVIPTEEDEAWIREAMDAPERNDDTKLLVNPNTPTFSVGDPNDPENPNDGPVPPVGGTPDSPKPAQGQPKGGAPNDQPKDGIKLAESFATTRPVMTGTKRSFTSFEENVDLKETRRVIEELGVQDTQEILTPILRISAEAIIRQVQRKNIIGSRNYTAIRDLTIPNKGDIKKTLQRSLERTAIKSVTAARKEIRASKLVDAAAFTEAALRQYINASAFKMAGDLTDNMIQAASNSIFKAVQNGASEKEAINGIFQSLERFFKIGAASAEDFTSARLDTILRTNTTGAYNFARREFFLEDTEITPAMQYSAILDDRVRPNHKAMDERIFRTTSSVWDIWTPANGFNCRCLLIPVTKFDDWNGIESSIPAAKPDNGFGKV